MVGWIEDEWMEGGWMDGWIEDEWMEGGWMDGATCSAGLIRQRSLPHPTKQSHLSF